MWLGDSLTRYEYLQLVYQIHNDGPGVEDAKMGGWGGRPGGQAGGNFLLNEKTYGSWTAFLKETSADMFNAKDSMMTCDCWRQGQADVARHVTRRIVNPHCLSCMACYDVASKFIFILFITFIEPQGASQ